MCLLHWQAGSLPPAPPRFNTYSFLVYLIVAHLCPTLCNPVNYSPPSSSVHGILQGRILEWVIFYFFMIPSWSVWVSRNLSTFFLSCPICWCIIVHRSLFDLIGIWRAFHPTAPEYTFFSNIHRILSRINRMLGHIASLNKLKKIKILSSIFQSQSYKTKS